MITTRSTETATTGPTSSIPDMSRPRLKGPVVVSAEQAMAWPIAGVVWHADLCALYYTSDHTLRLDAHFLRLLPRSEERWQLAFPSCAAFKVQPVGAPGNEPLTKPTQNTPLAPPPSVLYELRHSEWLPTCHPIGGAPGTLHHYVVYDTTQSLALHVAAAGCIGHHLDEQEALAPADRALLPQALVPASERGSA